MRLADHHVAFFMRPACCTSCGMVLTVGIGICPLRNDIRLPGADYCPPCGRKAIRRLARKTDDFHYWTVNSIHTKPVAEDLVILDALGMLEYVEGRSTKELSLLPFCVRVFGTPRSRFFCQVRSLHTFVDGLMNPEVLK